MRQFALSTKDGARKQVVHRERTYLLSSGGARGFKPGKRGETKEAGFHIMGTAFSWGRRAAVQGGKVFWQDH